MHGDFLFGNISVQGFNQPADMNGLWQSISRLFGPQPNHALPQDNTVYCIETNMGKYCGRIVYQDVVTMRLHSTKGKPVKILKTNIIRISPIASETVAQYQEWLATKRVSYSA